MTKTYECMVLLDNREVRQGWEPLKQTVTGMFKKYGAEVVSARRWDERRLAYPIGGQVRGTYLLVYYQAEGDANSGIRRDLELSEQVLRHLITSCEAIPAEAHEPEAAFDPTSIPEDVEPAPIEPEALPSERVRSRRASARDEDAAGEHTDGDVADGDIADDDVVDLDEDVIAAIAEDEGDDDTETKGRRKK